MIQLASKSKSLEAVANQIGRDPKAVAKSARRLGLSLKPRGGSKAKRTN